MGNLSKVLGVILANGLAGRTGRGPAFAAAMPLLMGKKGKKKGYHGHGIPHAPAGGMGLFQKAGLASLAYLAYRAYQDGQKGAAPSSHPSTPSTGFPTAGSAGGPLGGILDRLGLGGVLGGGAASGGGGALGGVLGGIAGGAAGGLGDRLAGVLRGGTPEPDLGDAKALLLIRAMIAAANADGRISSDEQHRILGSLDAAQADPEDRRIVEAELRSPKPMDEVVRAVRDPETAEQVYLASELAVRGGSEVDRQYLSYLASRLGLSEERRRELDSMV
ncbi:tellurite resistance TerB family protein [Azospirillum doebereinerae]|uniref:Tellurite resistance TerB family protein n=1 Tax=Azospirillum doebereinerae TaxID=92933 RepID=A0A3S0V0Y7_9PROT|nr:tellurite resistance TerB family protein [Azospirillum doebereinerae]RUQ70192.1 tellurite resistance TerB family protein [Azospirillum doebereinerae]